MTDSWVRLTFQHMGQAVHELGKLSTITRMRPILMCCVNMQVAPILLTKFLVAWDSSLPKEQVHQIKLTKKRINKALEQQSAPESLVKLTFSPFSLTKLQRKDFEGERAGYWSGAKDENFDPNHLVKSEIPTYLLERVLPTEVLYPPPAEKKVPASRKRQAEDINPQSNPTPKRKRPTPKSNAPAISVDDPAVDATGNSRFDSTASSSNQRSTSNRPNRGCAVLINLVSDSEDRVPPSKRPLVSKRSIQSKESSRSKQPSPSSRYHPSTRPSSFVDSADFWSDSEESFDGSDLEVLDLPRTSLQPRQRIQLPNARPARSEPEVVRDRLDRSPLRTIAERNMIDQSVLQESAIVPEMSRPCSDTAFDVSSVSEVRAARLRYFASPQDGNVALPIIHQNPMQTPSRSHSSTTTTIYREPPQEIETIDLT